MYEMLKQGDFFKDFLGRTGVIIRPVWLIDEDEQYYEVEYGSCEIRIIAEGDIEGLAWIDIGGDL